MSKISKEVKIGIAFVLALFLLYFGISFLKGINIFKPSNSYIAAFDDVSGMLIADPITVNGLKVGQVYEMRLNPENKDQVLVHIEMSKGVQIPKGSKLALDAGMLGGTTLILEVSESKEFYEAGDVIEGYKKKGMMDAAASMVPKIEQLLPKMDSILTKVTEIVSNPSLNATIDNFAQSSKELSVLLASMNKDLPQLTGKLDATLGNFEDISAEVKKINMVSTFNKLDSTMANIETLSASLASKEGSLGLLLNERQMYDSLNMTISNMSLLLKDLREHPSKYINVKVF